MAQKGRFVWYELMTNDVEAAKAFYTETIGWSITMMGEGDGAYSMWTVGEQPVGGLMLLPDEAKAMGAPPHWMAYVATDDVDATAKKAEELGGRIFKAPSDIPEVGRFAVIGDPQGATFALFKSAGDMPMHEGPPRPGDFNWHELNTTDYEAAWKFYAALLGWEATDSIDMGEGGTYFMFKCAGAPGSIGGMSNAAGTTGLPPHWLYYTTVDDIEEAIARIQSRGGKVLNGPMEVPGGDKVAQCQDPEGVAFAIHWPNPKS